MGGGRWSSKDWIVYYTARAYNSASTTTVDIYTSRTAKDVKDSGLDPKGVKLRESCDSADNPESTAIIIALDVTGSMGIIADVMARKGLPVLVSEVYNRKPVTDPAIMCMAVGDAEAGDIMPLQVTQFESATEKIANQMTSIWLEGRGGGNKYESYILPWYFAAMHTKIDCLDKRGKKGYLFTIGDEAPTPYLRAQDIERVLGYRPQQDMIMVDELFTMVDHMYNVFHIIVEEGGCGTSSYTKDGWNKVLGQRAIPLSDHTKLGEVIISTIQVCEGENIDVVTKSWDGSTGLVVANSLKGLSSITSAKDGLVTFD